MKLPPAVFTTCLLVALAGTARADEPEPLTIETAIARALSLSPQPRAAAARAEAAQGALDQAGRRPNPSFELRGEGIGGRDPWGPNGTLDFFALLSQPIELGGKRAERAAVAAAALDGARAERRHTEREVALQTMRLYLMALHARELIAALQENRAGLEPLLEMTRKRVEQGYAPEADLMKFRAEAEQREAQLAQARTELERATAALAALVGSGGRVAPAALVAPAPLPAPAGDTDALVQQATDLDPQIAAARARLEAARHALELEKARRIPDPLLTGGYERTSGADTGVAGVVVPIPVFDTNAGNVARAAAEERAAAAELQAAQLQLAAELTALFGSARDLERRAREVEERLVAPAAGVRQAARSSFREGASNILQLVDAERVYTDTVRQALDLRLEAYARAYEARLATGATP